MASGTGTAEQAAPARRDRTHWLYLAVIVAVILGIVVGFVFPDFAVGLKWLGTAFVGLIRMLIAPVIFCTIVLGIGAIRKAASVGRIGGLALGYFLVMSTVALTIGLVVGNLLHPGDGLQLSDALRGQGADLRHDRRGGRRHDRLPARPHPDDAAVRADRGLGAAGAAGRPAGRLRDPVDGPLAASRSCAASATCRSWSSASSRWSCGSRRSAPSAPSRRSSARRGWTR